MIRAAVICLALGLAPAHAQDTESVPEAGPNTGPGAEDGLDLIERGTRLLFDRLFEEIGPGMEELRDELGRQLGDMSGYYPPEVLPNGDIIIRRRTPLEPSEDEEVEI